MTIPRAILFPTDFSSRCDRARDRSIQLAHQWDARLIVLHVLKNSDPTATADESQAEEALIQARLRAEVTDEGIRVDTRLAYGAVAEAVLETAATQAADIIVTGIARHDDIGDFLIGTTVERVLRQERVPVLVVKDRIRQHYQRIMVATDFSDCSGQALRTAVAMFPAAEITLLHAYRAPLEALRGRAGSAPRRLADIALSLDDFVEQNELPIEVRDRLEINVDYGEVGQVARDHVKSSNTDLVVLGTHGRSALATAILGSTAQALLRGLECDVLLVRQHEKG